jgi:hypothetical protein
MNRLFPKDLVLSILQGESTGPEIVNRVAAHVLLDWMESGAIAEIRSDQTQSRANAVARAAVRGTEYIKAAESRGLALLT